MARFDRDRYGPAALVTGASSGIGAAFARRLAAQGLDLVLVARRRERLEALRAELTGAHGVRCAVLVADLTRPEAAGEIAEAIEAEGLELGLLVHNAGFGRLGPFGSASEAEDRGMVACQCDAVVALTRRLLPGLEARGHGGMILVSSVLARIPTPYMATYSASKAFELVLGEAIAREQARHGVDVLTVLPGVTETEFSARAGTDHFKGPTRRPEQVVSTALSALGRRVVAVDGWWNRLALLGLRLLPATAGSRLAGAYLGRVIGN